MSWSSDHWEEDELGMSPENSHLDEFRMFGMRPENSHLDECGTFYEIQQKQLLKMKEDLEKAYVGADKSLLDVTVTCGDASFKCNKFMLTARSPVFKAMFQHDSKENQSNVVEIKDIESKVLEEMLHYIHTGDAPNIKDLAKDLLAAADFYQLEQLKASCQELLSETLDAENALKMLILSDKYSAPKLRKNAIALVTENLSSNSVNWKEKLEAYPSIWPEIVDSLLEINEKLRKDLDSEKGLI